MDDKGLYCTPDAYAHNDHAHANAHNDHAHAHANANAYNDHYHQHHSAGIDRLLVCRGGRHS